MINCTFSDVFGPKNKQFVLAMFTEFMEECIACRSAVSILKNTELILFCLLFQVFENSLLTSDMNQIFDYGKAEIPTFNQD